MQHFAFALGHLMEKSFRIIVEMEWVPVIGTALLIFFGIVYWLNWQGKYNRKAKEDGTLA